MTEFNNNPHNREAIEYSEIETLQEKIARRIERCALLGADMRVSIGEDGVPGIAIGEQEVVPGASIKKLYIAYCWLSTQKGNPQYRFDDEFVTEEGGGIYDVKRGTQTAHAEQLLLDMIKRSGNTAANVLVNSLGVFELNEFLKTQGYESSNFQATKGGKGRQAYFFGDTTAEESRRSVEALCSMTPNEHVLAPVVLLALAESTSTKGVRNFYIEDRNYTLLNKTGAYPADKDYPYHVRHDVGIVANGSRKISYAFLSSSKSLIGARIAEQTMGMMGVDIAKTVGGKPPGRLGRSALRFFS